jgi:hypothetical protein
MLVESAKEAGAMATYFNCSLCHRISVMHQARARCPECGSRSGEFSCERPRAAMSSRAADEMKPDARSRRSRGRRSGGWDRRIAPGDRRTTH